MGSKAVKRNKFWTCPFFKWDGLSDLSCEGGRIRFPDAPTANEYMDTYCASCDWKKCSVAAALLDYYEKEDA